MADTLVSPPFLDRFFGWTSVLGSSSSDEAARASKFSIDVRPGVELDIDFGGLVDTFVLVNSASASLSRFETPLRPNAASAVRLRLSAIERPSVVGFLMGIDGILNTSGCSARDMYCRLPSSRFDGFGALSNGFVVCKWLLEGLFAVFINTGAAWSLSSSLSVRSMILWGISEVEMKLKE